MARSHVLGLALLLGSCFNPQVPLGLPCSESGLCPDGQICKAGKCDFPEGLDPSQPGTMRPPNMQPDAAAPVDAPVNPPAMPCTWRSGLVPPVLASTRVQAFWGSAANDVFAVGQRIIHWNGQVWATSFEADVGWLGLFGRGQRVWASGLRGNIFQFDGAQWTALNRSATSTNWRAVAGSGTADLWFIGDGPAQPPPMFHWDGTQMLSVTLVVPYVLTLGDIWGSTNGDVWTVGSERTILQLHQGAWSVVQHGGSEFLYAIWGSGPNDIWAAGAAGLLLHFDGSTWRVFRGASTQALHDVSGTAPDDAWAVGDSGAIEYWNGQSWQSAASGTAANLVSVWTSQRGDAWASGDGVLLHCLP